MALTQITPPCWCNLTFSSIPLLYHHLFGSDRDKRAIYASYTREPGDTAKDAAPFYALVLVRNINGLSKKKPPNPTDGFDGFFPFAPGCVRP
jgi:hypothetical protein